MAKISDADKKQLVDYCMRAKGKGINRISLHINAGRYWTVGEAYHMQIVGPGAKWPEGTIYFNTDDFAEVRSHTWKRNTGNLAFAICGGFNAQIPWNATEKKWDVTFGSEPPTPIQIEILAQSVAIAAGILDIPIIKGRVDTHAEIALGDGYGPGQSDPDVRWDLYRLPVEYDKMGGDVIRGKAIWYQQNGI